ncbi:hypothetical protein JCM11251_000175 [Rhodosporidiobolus azoricus]
MSSDSEASPTKKQSIDFSFRKRIKLLLTLVGKEKGLFSKEMPEGFKHPAGKIIFHKAILRTHGLGHLDEWNGLKETLGHSVPKHLKEVIRTTTLHHKNKTLKETIPTTNKCLFMQIFIENAIKRNLYNFDQLKDSVQNLKLLNINVKELLPI